MKRRTRAHRETADEGQLLLLAGIILILAFFLTSLSLGSLANLEKQTIQEQKNPLTNEFRLLRESIGTTMDDAATTSMVPNAFAEVFNATAEGMRTSEQSKGYEVVIALAGDDGAYEVNATSASHTELDFTEDRGGTRYYKDAFATEDGTVTLQNIAYDGSNDGVIHRATGCVAGGGPCVQAFLCYIYLSDGIVTIEETILFPVNNG